MNGGALCHGPARTTRVLRTSARSTAAQVLPHSWRSAASFLINRWRKNTAPKTENWARGMKILKRPASEDASEDTRVMSFQGHVAHKESNKLICAHQAPAPPAPGGSDDPRVVRRPLEGRVTPGPAQSNLCLVAGVSRTRQLGFLAYQNMLPPRKVEFWVKDARRLPGGT